MKRKLVEVTWEDAHSSAANVWQDAAAFDEESKVAVLCRSVGYVWLDVEDRLVLVASTHDCDDWKEQQVSGTLSIPRGMVRKVKVLK